MTELPRILRSALPIDPAPFDLAAISGRSLQLARRRRAAAGTAVAIGLAAAAVTFTVGPTSSDGPDRLEPAVAPTAPGPSAPTGRLVYLHFTTGCGDISPIQRRVDGPVLEASLRALLAGPTAQEQAQGTTSTFGPATAGLLRSVTTQNGSAYVDLRGEFRDRIRTERTECSNFAEQIGGTLRQFGGIAAVHYAYDGDPVDFVTAAGGTCPAVLEPGGLCDATPFQAATAAASGSAENAPIKAPPPSKISETDEFGLLTVVSRDRPLEVDVDRVDMLGGAEADAAARARGQEVSNDYFLVNDNPKLRRYEFSDQVIVWGSIGLTGAVDHRQVSVEKLVTFLLTPRGRSTLFHLDVERGVVVAIEEQYRP